MMPKNASTAIPEKIASIRKSTADKLSIETKPTLAAQIIPKYFNADVLELFSTKPQEKPKNGRSSDEESVHILACPGWPSG